MKVHLIAVGKAKAPFPEPDAHYRKLLSRHQPVEVIEVRDEANIERRIPEPRPRRRARPRRQVRSLAGLGELAGGAAPRRPRRLLHGRRARGLPPEPWTSPTSALARARRRWPTSSPASCCSSSSSARHKILAGEPYHH